MRLPGPAIVALLLLSPFPVPCVPLLAATVDGVHITERDDVPAAGSPDAAASTVRSYEIPGHGALQFVVPNSWKDSIRRPSRETPPTIVFSPPVGNDFQVLITALWSPRSEPGFNAPHKLRRAADDHGKTRLASSVEKTLVLRELKGHAAVGYLYTLTDREPGEYRYLTQGHVAVGDLWLSVSILFQPQATLAHRSALEMIRTVRQKKPTSR